LLSARPAGATAGGFPGTFAAPPEKMGQRLYLVAARAAFTGKKVVACCLILLGCRAIRIDDVHLKFCCPFVCEVTIDEAGWYVEMI
jgi:hypothetical protein